MHNISVQDLLNPTQDFFLKTLFNDILADDWVCMTWFCYFVCMGGSEIFKMRIIIIFLPYLIVKRYMLNDSNR